MMRILQVTHHFSHVHHHYHCWYVGYCGDGPGPHPHQKVQLLSTWLSGGSGSAKAGGKVRWTDRSDLCESAVPASVKKVRNQDNLFLMYGHYTIGRWACLDHKVAGFSLQREGMCVLCSCMASGELFV